MQLTMSQAALKGLDQCPRCQRANPTLVGILDKPKPLYVSGAGQNGYFFVGLYQCTTCNRTILAETPLSNATGFPQEAKVARVFPTAEIIPDEIPERPRQFLRDALASLSAPSASIMATCSAIDSMLKEKGIGRADAQGSKRSLYKRIEVAVDEGVLTKDMASWAHKVRLDSNDQRHADEDAPMPLPSQAQSLFELARGLGEILFVLPKKASEAEPDAAAAT